MRLLVKITSLCIFVAEDLSPNAKDLSPRVISNFQSQIDRRETNSLIIFNISHLFVPVDIVSKTSSDRNNLYKSRYVGSSVN